ncbi:hypothetical protein BC833DRAFT_441462 [Globomyces pollinis-pini]|nr:hypothetical protein BC833DRAFT_441462 [Globomyces pollinis-pini]
MFALQDLFKIETYSNGWNSILQRWSRHPVDRNKLSTDISDVSIETIETIESPRTPATGKGWSRFVRKSVMGANAPVFSFNRKNSEVNATEKNPKKKLKKKPKTRWFPFGKVAVASKREDELVTVTPMEVEIGCLAADEKCSVVTGKTKASVVEDPQLFLPAGSDVVAVLASGEPELERLVSTPLTEKAPAVQENQITGKVFELMHQMMKLLYLEFYNAYIVLKFPARTSLLPLVHSCLMKSCV